ncbi:MAG: CIA30 family protein [Ignavibacteriales bacterium]|nr:CIA30 family protein [Ignavibacteriales bacterium]
MNFLSIILAAIIMNNSLLLNEDNILLNSSFMQTENKWRIVNDGVMGGLSSSNVNVNEDNKIVFKGNVSLENNGGFASLRSPIKNYNFEKFSGIELRMKGDGKRYSISMKETAYFTGYFYTTSLETKKEEWMVIKIPFDEFKLYYYGKETGSSKKIPLNNIKEISLLIGDKQEGTFITEIDYIKLY